MTQLVNIIAFVTLYSVGGNAQIDKDATLKPIHDLAGVRNVTLAEEEITDGDEHVIVITVDPRAFVGDNYWSTAMREFTEPSEDGAERLDIVEGFLGDVGFDSTLEELIEKAAPEITAEVASFFELDEAAA